MNFQLLAILLVINTQSSKSVDSFNGTTTTTTAVTTLDNNTDVVSSTTKNAQHENLTTTESTTITTISTTVIKHTELKFVTRDSQDNQEVESPIGSDYTMDCRVEGYPEPNITWVKDERPMSETSYRVFKHDMTKVFKLTLVKLLTADSGRYKCTADNGISKTITTSEFLKVSEPTPRDPPEIEYFYPKKATIYVGESMKFFCDLKHVDDIRSPYIKWIRNSFYNATVLEHTASNSTNTTMETDHDDHHELIEDAVKIERMANITHIEDGMVHEHIDLSLNQCEESSHEIKSATLRDTGEYTCMVFNDKGYAKETAFLQVLPVPPLSKEELEKRYVEKYSKKNELSYSLAAVIGLPVFLVVILIVGCMYVQTHEKHSNKVDTAKEEKTEVEPRSTVTKTIKDIPEIVIQQIADGDSRTNSQQNMIEHVRRKEASESKTSLNKVANTETDGCVKTALLREENDHKNDNGKPHTFGKHGSVYSLDGDWEHV